MPNLTEEQLKRAQEFRTLEAEYGFLAYRQGTDGEKGLYHKMKKARKDIFKMKEEFKNKWNLKIYGTSMGKVVICTFEEYEEQFGKS